MQNNAENQGVPRRTFLTGLLALGMLPSARAGDLAPVTTAPRTESELPPQGDGESYWRRVRGQFAIPDGEAYFNTGTLGACPRPVIDAVSGSMREMEESIARYDYRPEHPEYIAGYRSQMELRQRAGGLINAKGTEVALVQNATFATNLIAHGLDLKPGDEVLLTDQEHPGARGAWDLRAKREGIKPVYLAIPIPTPDPETVVRIFAEAINSRTRVIAVPHITSKYGIVMPVRQLCELGRQHGLFTFVDGAQAVGQLRVDVQAIGCDAYGTSLHKWLLAPPGNGLLYVREERSKDLWATLASAQWDNYAPADGLYRLMQFGTANAALLVGLLAALDFNQRIGPEKIEKRVLLLADRLRAGLRETKKARILSPSHPDLAGAMVNFALEGVSGLRIMDELWNRGKIRVRAQGQEGVRQSVHYYNSPEEIDATLRIIREL